MEKAIGTQAIEPWLADISRTLEKLIRVLEEAINEGIPVVVMNEGWFESD